MNINELIISDDALNLIDNGTWVGDFPEAPGVELLVCGLRSKDARKSMEQKQTQARLKNRGKALTDEQMSACTRETLAEVVLKDWRGLEEGGTPLAYSKEMAAKWLTSRNGEKFVGLVIQAAQRVDEQASEFVEDAIKN